MSDNSDFATFFRNLMTRAAHGHFADFPVPTGTVNPWANRPVAPPISDADVANAINAARAAGHQQWTTLINPGGQSVQVPSHVVPHLLNAGWQNTTGGVMSDLPPAGTPPAPGYTQANANAAFNRAAPPGQGQGTPGRNRGPWGT